VSAPRLPRGAPWSLLYLLALEIVAVSLLGVDRAVTAAAIAMNVVFIVYLFRHLAFAATAARYASRDLRRLPDVDVAFVPTVTVMVACHNEAVVARNLVAGLRGLDYPGDRLDVILVDDGSQDGTGPMLEHLTATDPHIRVLHRPPGEGGGKSGALNAALERATGEIIVVFDADHVPSPDVVRRLVRHFADARVSAAQGRCVITNWGETPLARAIAIDYFSGYLVNEYGRQALFELPAYGGANCAVRASTLRRLGGWNPATVTEDTDLTMRVLLSGERVRYDVTAVDTEQAPTTIRWFMRQRYRWARGHQQVWRDYRRAVLATPHLGTMARIETLMFLLVFHVPVVCAATFVLLAMRLAGIGHPITLFELLPLTALLFAGPFCELAVGLVVGRAPRWTAWSLALMLPVFIVSITVTTKAWIDGLLGVPYAWVKTRRSGAEPSTPERVAA
jgi:cellulose synthase/poly-beta-1,6-N-acetylglucosamine synthase-like glycosyltransferase